MIRSIKEEKYTPDMEPRPEEHDKGLQQIQQAELVGWAAYNNPLTVHTPPSILLLFGSPDRVMSS